MDNIFNFFITVGHIPDYVGRRSDVSQHALDTLRQNASIKLARDLCDTGKHVELNKSGRTTASGAAYENSIFARRLVLGILDLKRLTGWFIHRDSLLGSLNWQTNFLRFGKFFFRKTA